MKKNLVNHFAKCLHSYGYKVYISGSGEYGFYTDGEKVISFGGHRNFLLDISGNYKTSIPEKTGTGWQIISEVCDVSADDAKKWINAIPPFWAVGHSQWRHSTPEEHLAVYGRSSNYIEYKGA